MEPKWHTDWPKWIDVNEEMPSGYGVSGDGKTGISRPVLCYAPSKGKRIGWYNFNRKQWMLDGAAGGEEVTHWIPLPESPE